MTRQTDSHHVDYRLSDADRNIHSAWDNSLDPVLTVNRATWSGSSAATRSKR